MRRKRSWSNGIGFIVALLAAASPTAGAGAEEPVEGERLPTGMRITPTVARGAQFNPLNPDLPTRPDYLADHAVSTALSPSGETLLVLTSGYNRNNNPAGERVAAESNEYVFVYDVRGGHPLKKQVVQVPNTFAGLAWSPLGHEFYVAGGVDDNVHVFTSGAGGWASAGAPVPLGHNNQGQGPGVRPLASGLAVNPAGTRLLVANYENDSVSLVDLAARVKVAELDLRPGKTDPARAGVPGGEYPFWPVWKGNDKAYVSSVRDREVVVLGLQGDQPAVVGRIQLPGQPNKMILDRAGSRLYVACDNSDSVAIVDTTSDAVLEELNVAAPKGVLPRRRKLKGAAPNDLALSPDEQTLFVTNGGLNAVAVVQLARPQSKGQPEAEAGRDRDGDHDDDDCEHDHERDAGKSHVIGLIPTGWYPSAISVSRDGGMLYVLNGKSNAGPNPEACRDTLSIAPGASGPCNGRNQYVWQLHKAGFLSLPVPQPAELAGLTWQVAFNNKFKPAADHQKARAMMAFLRKRIKHVIYVVKENRTYDQVHGDLPRGNGDPSLAILSPYSPNHQKLASQFVLLDNFYDSGETSNTGWNWTTAARATDFSEKTSPVNYAGRGLTYDWEGSNRNMNVGLPTLAERQAANPATPSDPDLLPGTADVAAPDSPEGEAGTGYLWDAALRAGLTIRNYGFFVNNLGNSNTMPPEVLARPFAAGVKQAIAAKQALAAHTDEYFRGYDQNNADFHLFQEWEREFDAYVATDQLPNLSFVRLPHDHFGNFGTAKFGVNTVETQMADNDYAVGLLVQKVARSPFKDDTLVFVIEDDAQNGGDHVDPHRSIAYVAGPYVKQGAAVSRHFTTVSMLRTIEEVLGLPPLGLYDGLAEPMAEVFDRNQKRWDYEAVVPEVLYTTQLPLPPRATAKVVPGGATGRTAQYWATAMAGQDFASEDRLDEPRFNRALWAGLKGEQVPFPTHRHGRDLRSNRVQFLRRHAAQLARPRLAVEEPAPRPKR